jgi:hypothetical protein
MRSQLQFAILACVAGISGSVLAQQQQQPPPPQFPNMSFFITSIAGSDGANLGGLEGADKICQDLAATAGAGSKTWRAYLSQQAVGGKLAVNARDRIGKGPWVNAVGMQIAANVDDLHNPERNNITSESGLTEMARKIPTRPMVVNYHDIMTGSLANGTAPPPDKDLTCGNWTKNGEGSAMLGHLDRMGTGGESSSWNAAHPSVGCSPPALLRTGGNGLLYCFAAN